MKQLVQNLKNGDTYLEDVPAPLVQDGYVLIRSVCSLVSAGTERMLVSFGKAGWLGKARQQPERVKDVINKIKTDGFQPTVDAVFNKLDKPIPLGYSNAGVVLAVGRGVKNIAVGDRVASNGYHAEIVSVPQNLVAKIPDSVSDDHAAFTVVGAIALQGIRLTNPSFGETVVVMGLGLIGQITVQLLKANGCKVIGIDPDEQKAAISKKEGIQVLSDSAAVVNAVLQATNGNGADAVIITAASQSHEIIAQAAQMSRKRGRIILTGVVGLDINRADFYEKELSFQVSCSYGPGRYDAEYEQKGNDYPIGFVRWTEQRNFETVLHAIATGQLNPEPLLSRKVALADYQAVYEQLDKSSDLATLLSYPDTISERHKIQYQLARKAESSMIAGIVGCGNFATSVVLPILKKQDTDIVCAVSEKGLSAATVAQKYNLPYATTDYQELLEDKDCNTVFILTRHNRHAAQTIAALQAGKHVFVEKPLALTPEELAQIKEAYEHADRQLLVGYNRRHAPLSLKAKKLIAGSGPINIVITINAGSIPASSWIQDPAIGGGRILGEVCHFVDLCCYYSASMVGTVYASALADNPTNDSLSINLKMQNGSNCVINYFANGHKSYSKERVEIYSAGRTLILDNWRKLTGYGFDKFSSLSASQDKGHATQFKRLELSIKKGIALIPFHELINVSEACFAIEQSLKENTIVQIN